MNAPLPLGRELAAWQLVEQLGARAQQAESEAALLFAVANDSHALQPYRSAVVLTRQHGGMRFVCQSGLTSVDRRSAFGSFCEELAQTLLPTLLQGGPVSVDQVPASLRQPWQEVWPDQVQVFALRGADAKGREQPLGLVIYVSEQPWPEQTRLMFSVLHQSYGLCLQQLRARRRPLGRLLGGRHARRYLLALLLALVAVLCVPVRQFVVAPAEVISLDSVAVTSPVEGIVAALVAKPNEAVKKGQVLVRLDDTAIRNRLASARQGLEVARAEYLAGAHRAFVSTERSSESGVLRGRINERLAEVAFLQEQMAMQEIRALRDGVVVYGQENDWIGKPVAPGQRIMELADASQLGVLVWVPVADAINLESGAPFTLLLHADPLKPLKARIERAGYQATKSPEGVAAYRVRAQLEPDAEQGGRQAPRLGLRGSAKIDGPSVPLAYFLLRRPLLAARQWLGV